MHFSDLNLNKFLLQALVDLGFEKPTSIQEKSFSPIMSSKDIVGIAQTGTGKTLAYVLPILRQLKFSNQKHPRVLILVPTRELVVQVVDTLASVTTYINVRYTGVYGGTNMNKQKEAVFQGQDIIVATPGRLLDLALDGILKLKYIQKLVIDEVDEMLNLGFRPQLTTVFDFLPISRQNILFSATLSDEVADLLETFFKSPLIIEDAESGTPLSAIEQRAYPTPNFYTKINFLTAICSQSEYKKVLIFVKTKKIASFLFDELSSVFNNKLGVIHSNKSQNYRLNTVSAFENNEIKFLIATDIVARGIDFTNVSHVINMDIPDVAETYIHRIGRTGRVENKGIAISLFTEEEASFLGEIEELMSTEIEVYDLPKEVEISTKLIESELPEPIPEIVGKTRTQTTESGPAFHEKKEKNKKVNLGGSYRRKIAEKYKKPKTRGQKRK